MTSENPVENDYSAHNTKSTAQQNPNQSETPISPTTSPKKPKPQEPPTHCGHQITCKTERDKWDKVKLGAELIGLVFLIAYTTFAALQWCEIRKTNKIALDSLHAQTRPWIRAVDQPRSVTGSISEDSKSVHAEFDLNLRNYGQYPAIFTGQTATTFPFKFFTVGNIPRRSLFVEHHMCDEADKGKTDPRGVTSVIYPGEDGTITQHFSADLDPRPTNAPPGAPPVLIGCIAYEGPEGSTYYLQLMYGIETSPDRRIISLQPINPR